MRKLPREIIRQIWDRTSLLSDNPFPVGVKKLVNAEYVYRLRIGDYRIVYKVDQEMLSIEIVVVGHRRDIYR
ncbi:MAG: type II toxin-antitoxin system RelE family toxin [Leptospirillum sp.]